MKTDKELADEIDAADRLLKHGYTRKQCPHCKGVGQQCDERLPFPSLGKCYPCDGKGFKWEAPIER